jgi:DnaJ-class molecular chaperone
VELTIPPNSNGGRTLRLRAKGLPAGGGMQAGDLLVSLRIILPDGRDPELEALAQRQRSEKPYDPRKSS